MGIRGLIQTSDIIEPPINIYFYNDNIYSIAPNGYFIYNRNTANNIQTDIITTYAKSGKTIKDSNDNLFIYSNGYWLTRAGYIYYNYYYKSDLSANIISGWNPSFNNNNTDFANPNIINNNTFNILDDQIIVGGEFTKVNNKNSPYFIQIDSISGQVLTYLKSMIKPLYIVNSENNYITSYDTDYVYLMQYFTSPVVQLSGSTLTIPDNINLPDTTISNIIHIDHNNILITEPYLTYFATRNGAAFLYKLDTENNLIKSQNVFPQNIQANQMFANSMSYSSVSEKLAIGAPGYNSYRGKVYVYDYNSLKLFDNEISITPTLTAADFFGYSTAIYNDKLIVGAPNTLSGAGAVYYYKNISDIWTLQQTLSAPAGETMFGLSLDLYDTTLAITAPKSTQFGTSNGAIYTYTYSDLTSSFQYNTMLGPQFLAGFNATNYNLGGGSTYTANTSSDLILSANLHNIGTKIKMLDENNIFVSAINASTASNTVGLVYHFKYDTTSSQWTTAQVLSSTDITTDKIFGSNLSLYRNNLLVTSSNDIDTNQSAIYMYINDGVDNLTLDRVYTNNYYTSLASMSDNIFTYDNNNLQVEHYLLPEQITLLDDNDATGPIFNNYEFIERIKGVNRIGMDKLHKSNIFSIEINNSKLNENIIDLTLRQRVQKSVINVIKEIIKKIIPAHTKLWKIDWTGD